MFLLLFFSPSGGRVGLVNHLQRGFCTENEAGQSGATQLGMCGMSSGSWWAISITQPAIKATRAQSPGTWLKVTQTQGFLPRCRLRFSADVCGLLKELQQTAFAPSPWLVTAVCIYVMPWQPGAWSGSETAARVSLTRVTCRKCFLIGRWPIVTQAGSLENRLSASAQLSLL